MLKSPGPAAGTTKLAHLLGMLSFLALLRMLVRRAAFCSVRDDNIVPKSMIHFWTDSNANKLYACLYVQLTNLDLNLDRCSLNLMELIAKIRTGRG